MHLKPQPPDHQHQTLYNEFLEYIKGVDRRDPLTTTQLKYKKLYSDIRKGLREKRGRVQTAHNLESKLRLTGCKFQKIEGVKQY